MIGLPIGLLMSDLSDKRDGDTPRGMDILNLDGAVTRLNTETLPALKEIGSDLITEFVVQLAFADRVSELRQAGIDWINHFFGKLGVK